MGSGRDGFNDLEEEEEEEEEEEKRVKSLAEWPMRM